MAFRQIWCRYASSKVRVGLRGRTADAPAIASARGKSELSEATKQRALARPSTKKRLVSKNRYQSISRLRELRWIRTPLRQALFERELKALLQWLSTIKLSHQLVSKMARITGDEPKEICKLFVAFAKLPIVPNSSAYQTLFDHYLSRSTTALRERLEEMAEQYIIQNATGSNVFRTRCAIADYRYPTEWYPDARAVKRKIIMHVGPTNSGKTYHALKKLENVSSGWFAGPLRLLAHEIYERLNAKGIPTNLITGEERKILYSVPAVVSSTVEMFNSAMDLDMVVLDEIQMIADKERGWAWTAVLLSARAKEIHCCGEASAVGIVQKIAEELGEEVVVNKYARLSPLQVSNSSLHGNLRKLQPGDCVVTFSRRDIFTLKDKIETTIGLKCATVYGALPPELRSEQANLFNNPDSGFNILVASDAIGLGLNLNIRRIIFERLHKFNGVENVTMPAPLIKQIAGRAGRFKSPVAGDSSAKTSVGYVTTLYAQDLLVLQKAMEVQPQQLVQAGLKPTDSQFEQFALQFSPEVSFATIVKKLKFYAQISDHYFLSGTDNHPLAQLLSTIKGLGTAELVTLSAAPVREKSDLLHSPILDTAKAIAEGKCVTLKDVSSRHLKALEEGVPDTVTKVAILELCHRDIMLHLWLAYVTLTNMSIMLKCERHRFPAFFSGLEEAWEMKIACEKLISDGLVLVTQKKNKYRDDKKKIALKRKT